ncbi:MAG TPA: hypothetical protein PLY16_01805 [Candidatus Saccharibacteria bacterium]|nr:hypothetical protein [Candidatus Saccharibacteria bacterium]
MFVPSTIFNGWVLSVIWNWFMPVIFPALGPLTIIQAIGLSLTISVFIPSSADNKKEESATWLEIILTWLYKTLGRGSLFLLLGFVFQLFL